MRVIEGAREIPPARAVPPSTGDSEEGLDLAAAGRARRPPYTLKRTCTTSPSWIT